MGSLIVISWRDIRAQVIVKRGRESAKVQLSHRFQEAVDRAAMRAGKGSSDAYLADWAPSAPRPVGEIGIRTALRSEEHTSELQSPEHLVCRLLLEKEQNNRSEVSRTAARAELNRHAPRR